MTSANFFSYKEEHLSEACWMNFKNSVLVGSNCKKSLWKTWFCLSLTSRGKFMLRRFTRSEFILIFDIKKAAVKRSKCSTLTLKTLKVSCFVRDSLTISSHSKRNFSTRRAAWKTSRVQMKSRRKFVEKLKHENPKNFVNKVTDWKPKNNELYIELHLIQNWNGNVWAFQ